MKKIKKLFSIGLALLLMLCMGFVVGCTDNNQKENVITATEKNTDVRIPQECKLLYNYTPENLNIFPVPGRDEDYYVFEFENEPTEFLEENGFSDEKSVDYEEELLRGDFGLMELSMAEKIPEEYMLDFDSQYFWLEMKGYYFTYFTDMQRLIIFVKPY